MKPQSKKAKGTRLERWVVKQFEAIGIRARRQPLSGALSDFPHDCYADIPGFGPAIIEAKSWKHGWRTGDRALGQGDMLVIKRDYGSPCVYMSWSVFEAMVKCLAESEG